ncbi:MAG: isocitrate lyase/phosphoenolpyruvate mutase family protein [Pseudomonadota bacterium]
MTTLKARLAAAPPILLVPGVHDGLTAALAEQAGAEAVYLSGAAMAYARHGRPDIGLVSMAEVAQTLAIVRDRIEVQIIVDADDGFGNALNVQRTVRVFERAGANGIQIEDQTSPKRCGHLKGKQVIAKDAMVGKVRAALDARSGPETVIIARTDAIAVEGFDAALDRARAYSEAGADMIFLDALQSIEQMQAAVAALPGVNLLANMVEGGKTPLRDADQLQELGFAAVIFPGGIVRAQAALTQDYYRSLITHRSNAPFADRMLDFDGLNRIIGTDEMLAHGKRYDPDAQG